MNKEQPEIIVFSTPTCPWCVLTKQFLQSKGVEFEDRDVAEDMMAAAQMVQRSGQMGVPQLWIGEELVIGFDKQRIEQLLGA